MCIFAGHGGTGLQQILQLRFSISTRELLYQRYFELSVHSIIGATEKRQGLNTSILFCFPGSDIEGLMSRSHRLKFHSTALQV